MKLKGHLSKMRLELRLIGLYSFIEECYTTQLCWQSQRFSNNNVCGDFTDVELLTCYFFALMEEQRFQVKQMHGYIKKYWHSWFPDLPSYQAFNRRLNRLEGSIPLLLGILSGHACPCGTGKDLLLDSMPIMLGKGKRTGKVAPEMADKTYSSSKGMYYYGVKLHCMGAAQADGLPLPVWIDVAEASQHDLSGLKRVLHQLWGCRVFGDKAYLAQEVVGQLEKQDSQLLCPEKCKKGESVWERQFNHAYRVLQGRAVSGIRQPIEAFFNWLIEKVGIQDASKVRSTKGLNVHIFGKFAAAMFILLGF